MDTPDSKGVFLPGENVSVNRAPKRKSGSPWKYEPIQLRPCEVCGERATGYHFGVISCEACKSFYRRSLKRNRQYLCEKGDNCPTDTRGSSSCPACRLKKCVLVGMSPNAVKKGRYSYEKRAETIIQSRSYWQNKFESNEVGDEYQQQSQFVQNMGQMPDSYVEHIPGSSIHYAEEINPIPVAYVEEVGTAIAAYEEEVPSTSSIVDHTVPHIDSNIQQAPKSKKSLREILGMVDSREGNEAAAILESSVDGVQLSQHSLSDLQSQQENHWAANHSQVYTNLQPVPVPYPTTSQGSVNVQHIAPSPGALSDDSGVYLLSPNNLPACSPSMNSIPPASPFKTVTISEPQTQAKIVEMVPGKVRSINMRREMVIDGQPVSYLLEGVLVAPSPESNTDEAGKISDSSTPNSSPKHTYETSSIADEMCIDGKPIAMLLQNILDDISDPETNNDDTATSGMQQSGAVPFSANIDQECAVNQVMIDGKPIYQMFEMFSQANRPARTETISLPSIATLTQKQRPAPIHQQTISHMQQSTAPVQQQTTSANNTSMKASTSYALPTGSSGSPTMTDIQETAQTLINMASMPMDGAITSTVNNDDLQSSFIPDSTTLADPGQEQIGNSGNLTVYKPNIGSGAFMNALISDNDENTDIEMEKLMKDGIVSSSIEDIKNLDKLIDKIYSIVEANKYITKDFMDKLPGLESKFLEERKKKEEMFGKLGPIPSEDYLKIYNETGIDVDGRGQIIQETMEMMDPVMKKLIAFYKCLPGFQMLPIDDQITIIKGTNRELGFFMNYPLYNCKEKLVTSPFLNKTFDLSYFLSFTDEETMEVTFALVDRVQSLKLSDLENAIVGPLIVMQSEHCKTEHGKRICEEQRKVNLKAFHRALCKTRPDEHALNIVQETLSILKSIKSNREKLHSQCSKFIVDYKHINFPKLFTEIFVD